MQVGTLQASLPNLTPSFLPASTERDLLRLAELEGRAGEQALLEVKLFHHEDNKLILVTANLGAILSKLTATAHHPNQTIFEMTRTNEEGLRYILNGHC